MSSVLDMFEVDEDILQKIENYCQNLEVLIPAADTNRMVITSVMRLGMMGFKYHKYLQSLSDPEQVEIATNLVQGIVLTTVHAILPAIERRSYNREQRQQLRNAFKLINDLYGIDVDIQDV